MVATKARFQDFAAITMWMNRYHNAGIRSAVIDLCEFARAASPPANDDDGRRTVARHQDAAAALTTERASGSVIRNSAPRPARFSAEIWPP
jgi:hypothetical protein